MTPTNYSSLATTSSSFFNASTPTSETDMTMAPLYIVLAVGGTLCTLFLLSVYCSMRQGNSGLSSETKPFVRVPV